MKSDRGEIEVFLCPEEDALASHLEDSASDDTQSPIKIKREEDIGDAFNAESFHHQVSSHLIGSPNTSTNQVRVGSPCTNTWEAPSRTENEDDNQVCTTLCSGNFQNVKLRLNFVEN